MQKYHYGSQRSAEALSSAWNALATFTIDNAHILLTTIENAIDKENGVPKNGGELAGVGGVLHL
jgi:hypothetical protein